MTRFANIQSLAVVDVKNKKVPANINKSPVLSCRMLCCQESLTLHKDNVQRIDEILERKVLISLRSREKRLLFLRLQIAAQPGLPWITVHSNLLFKPQVHPCAPLL